jgi:hypothetical protein
MYSILQYDPRNHEPKKKHQQFEQYQIYNCSSQNAVTLFALLEQQTVTVLFTEKLRDQYNETNVMHLLFMSVGCTNPGAAN